MLPSAAAYSALELASSAQEEHTVRRAHRALTRRHVPNELTPPAAAPRYRRIQYAYRSLKDAGFPDHEESSTSGACLGSDILVSEKLTAPAFIHAGLYQGNLLGKGRKQDMVLDKKIEGEADVGDSVLVRMFMKPLACVVGTSLELVAGVLVMLSSGLPRQVVDHDT